MDGFANHRDPMTEELDRGDLTVPRVGDLNHRPVIREDSPDADFGTPFSPGWTNCM